MKPSPYVFLLQYTNAQTGQRVTSEIDDLATARQLAKSLAIASGNRAIITRKYRVRLWDVYVFDNRTGETWKLWSGLTKAEVVRRWRLWRERKTDCVLVAWPQWLPDILIDIKRAS